MLEKLKRLLPEAEDEQLLNDLLDYAREMIMAYTHRESLPETLDGVQIRLAAVLFNRMGIEGEISHSEGGVSRSIEAMPGDIKAQLNQFRLARTVK